MGARRRAVLPYGLYLGVFDITERGLFLNKVNSMRPFYCKPFTLRRWAPVTHGGMEGNRATLVIGNPIIGHVVFPLKRTVHVGRDKTGGWVSRKINSGESVWTVRKVDVDNWVAVYYDEDTGEPLLVEVKGN